MGGGKLVSISRHKQVSRFTRELFIYELCACFSLLYFFLTVSLVRVTVDIIGGVYLTVKAREKNVKASFCV